MLRFLQWYWRGTEDVHQDYLWAISFVKKTLTSIAHALTCTLDSDSVTSLCLPAVFQGLNSQLLSVLQEKSTLVNELIALQDNFLQEQSLTTVLIFLTDACVLHWLVFHRLSLYHFDVVVAILNCERQYCVAKRTERIEIFVYVFAQPERYRTLKQPHCFPYRSKLCLS